VSTKNRSQARAQAHPPQQDERPAAAATASARPRMPILPPPADHHAGETNVGQLIDRRIGCSP
jgi:hypothetical protein